MRQIKLRELLLYRLRNKLLLMSFGLCYAVISFWACQQQQKIIESLSSHSQKLMSQVLILGFLLLTYRLLEYIVRILGAKESEHKINYIYRMVYHVGCKSPALTENITAFINGNLPYHIRIMSHFFNEIFTSIWLILVPVFIYPFIVSPSNILITLGVFILVVTFCMLMIRESFKLNTILKGFKHQDKLRSRYIRSFIVNLFDQKENKNIPQLLIQIEYESYLEKEAKIALIRQISKINILSFFGPYFCICGALTFFFFFSYDSQLVLKIIWASLFLLITPMRSMPWIVILLLDMKSSIAEINNVLSGKDKNSIILKSQNDKVILKQLLGEKNPQTRSSIFKGILLFTFVITCPLIIRGLCNYFNYFVGVKAINTSTSNILYVDLVLVACFYLLWFWWNGIAKSFVNYQFIIHQSLIRYLNRVRNNLETSFSVESLNTCFNYHYQNITKVLTSSLPEMLFLLSGLLISTAEGFLYSYYFPVFVFVWMFTISSMYFFSRSKTKILLDQTNLEMKNVNDRMSYLIDNREKRLGSFVQELWNEIGSFSQKLCSFNLYQAKVNMRMLLLNDFGYTLIIWCTGSYFYVTNSDSIAFLSGLLALTGYLPRTIRLFFYAEEGYASKRFTEKTFGFNPMKAFHFGKRKKGHLL